jgi:hypothetical protein
MKNIDWYFVNKILDKQFNKFYEKKYTISDIKNQIMKKKESALEIKFINGKILSKRLDNRFKDNRKRHIENFMKIVANKFPNINTTIYCNVNDWSCKEDMEFPIFVMSGFYNSNNFIIPDYLFMRDFSKRSGRNNDNDTLDNIVQKYKNGNWINKQSKCFFRAGTQKNKIIIDMFNNHPIVDARWSNDNFLTYNEMYNYRYVISHFMRWDSIYLFLRTNIVVFLYQGFNQYLWYDLFLENDKHYVGFKTKEEFDIKIKFIENNPIIGQKIIKNANKISNLYFNIDFAVEYVGNLLLKYQKLLKE